jgi:hypothetical protein
MIPTFNDARNGRQQRTGAANHIYPLRLFIDPQSLGCPAHWRSTIWLLHQDAGQWWNTRVISSVMPFQCFVLQRPIGGFSSWAKSMFLVSSCLLVNPGHSQKLLVMSASRQGHRSIVCRQPVIQNTKSLTSDYIKIGELVSSIDRWDFLSM